MDGNSNSEVKKRGVRFSTIPRLEVQLHEDGEENGATNNRVVRSISADLQFPNINLG